LAEDNDKLGKLTAESLRLSGQVVELAATAEDAEHLAEVETYDVIILDRMLPNDQDGLNVCARLRKAGNSTPVLILTALGNVERRLEGFEQGADDYLAKPFDMRELIARITALARRPKATATPSVIEIGEVTINLSQKQVLVRGEEVHLGKRLWALLEYLALHRGKTISKDMLIDHVWGRDSDVLENAVEAAVRKIRRSLGDDQGDIIQTIHGFGYRLKA
ncbi:MAG TPA: response regulator transcription factor, partial [Candidatus Saccharimonadales bacterium]|nr:response regulator transcription factor [Candidatus Saccharimonadales bacterium]